MARSNSPKFKLHLVGGNPTAGNHTDGHYPARRAFSAADEHDTDPDSSYESWADDYADQQSTEAPRDDRPETVGRRIVTDGRSGRELIDEPGVAETFAAGPVSYSSWDVAAHGPTPRPEWLITSLSAIDTPLGVLKTGKEADVHLLDRGLPGGPGCLLAVKTYRSAEHRMFQRDSGYQEGRRVRRSREGRAMAARTSFGRDLLSGKWAAAEFDALTRLWQAGARVPYPVQLIGSELMMEFIGTAEGVAASRLAAFVPERGDNPVAVFTELWHDLVATLELLASMGLSHGDLSPYNVLVADDHCVLIDLPQVVDVIANPQGPLYLARDAAIIAEFFRRRGVGQASAELLRDRLADQAGLT